jgi:hypothetical protein
MRKIIIAMAMSLFGCQTGLEPIPPGEKTYRCEVSDYGQVNCQPEWEFKKK